GFVVAAQGQLDEAVSAFKKALAIQPASKPTVLALGDALRRSGRADEAADLYEKRLENEPDDAKLRIRLAQVLREGGKSNEALEQIRSVLRKDRNNVAPPTAPRPV